MPCGSRRSNRMTNGCSRPAAAAATNIQPSTRCDAATTRRSARVAPNMATASTADRGVSRRRSVGSGAAMGTYSIEHMALSDPAPAPGAEHTAERLASAVPAPPVHEVDLDWRSVLVLLAALVGLIAVTGLFRSVPRTITALAIAVVVALALDPVVELVRRRLRLPRAPAIAAVLAALAAVFAVVGWLLVPPAVDQ